MKTKYDRLYENNKDWLAAIGSAFKYISCLFLIGLTIGVVWLLRTSSIEAMRIKSVHYSVDRVNHDELRFGNYLNKSRITIEPADFQVDYHSIAEFIASFEGFRSTCYEDFGGSSIGFGFACRDREYMSRSAAVSILRNEVERISEIIPKGLYSQGQYTALVSLMFNAPNLQRNQYFLADLRTRDVVQIQYYFKARVNGKINGSWVQLRGLVKRRGEELVLFNKL